MSLISKLTSLGAAGASGGDSGWFVEIDPSRAGNANLHSIRLDTTNDIIYAGGQVGSSPTYGYLIKGDISGDFTAGYKYFESGAASGTYRIDGLELFPNGGGLLAAFNMYSNQSTERSAAVDINTSTLAASDLDSGLSSGYVRGWKNANARSGNCMICAPNGNDVWLGFSGWNNGNTSNILLKHGSAYNTSTSYVKDAVVYSTQYPRSMLRDGNEIYYNALSGPATGQGGYGNLLFKITASTGDQEKRCHNYSSSGGQYGAQQTQCSDGNYGLAVDSTHIYTIGHHGLNHTTTTSVNMTHVQKILKSNMSLVWQRKWQEYRGGSYHQGQGKTIAVDSNGNVYGLSKSNGYYDSCKIVKYNSSGTLQNVVEVRTHVSNNSKRLDINACQIHGDFLYVAGRVKKANDDFHALVAKLPLDLTSAVGTYGDFTIYQLSNSEIAERTNYSTFTSTSGGFSNHTPQASNWQLNQSTDGFASETLTSL